MGVLENSFGGERARKGYIVYPRIIFFFFFCLGCQYLMLISLGFVLFFGEKHFFSPGIIYFFTSGGWAVYDAIATFHFYKRLLSLLAKIKCSMGAFQVAEW